MESGVMEHTSGSISETRKDGGKVAMEDLYRNYSVNSPTLFRMLPLHLISSPRLGLATPTNSPIENCWKTSAHKRIVCMDGLWDFLGNRRCGHNHGLPNFWQYHYYLGDGYN